MLHRRRLRSGFTLIELLVVISIIGVLVGLLLPAVNAAREAGRRAQCANNIRNQGLGILGYANAKNYFPNSGTFREDSSTDPSDPSTSVIARALTSPTIAQANTAAGGWMSSWVVDILGYLDSNDLANAWDKTVPYGYGTPATVGQPSNLMIGNNALAVLRCPNDTTVQQGQGNLSYAVNSGFTLFLGTQASFTGGSPNAGTGTPQLVGLSWGEAATAQKLGLMFPGTTQGNLPWDYKSSLGGITDGASSTVLLTENTAGGYSTGATRANGAVTNWACPLPTFVSFIGSPFVCGNAAGGGPLNCRGGSLTPTATADGVGWAQANLATNGDNINGGQNVEGEGIFPFSNSGHPSGCNMFFAGGETRFISSTIDGTVYAKILTPAGSKLPVTVRQLPVSQDDFIQ